MEYKKKKKIKLIDAENWLVILKDRELGSGQNRWRRSKDANFQLLNKYVIGIFLKKEFHF